MIVLNVILEIILRILDLIVPLLLGIAYLTLSERKVIAALQKRKGPNTVGLFGLLQPLADGLKLFLKETIVPREANKIVFVFAPIITFVLSVVGWCVIPFNDGMVLIDIDVGVLYIFAVSSLGVYGIIMAGWSSNSKYAFLGAFRSAAQMISYEICMGLMILCVVMCSGSFNFTKIVQSQSDVWYINGMLPLFILYVIGCLAESNRHPFDLPEAEAELVAGYNVEYSSMGFALFFLGEYGHMILTSSLISIFFLGGWLPPLAFLSFVPSGFWLVFKMYLCLYFFIVVRAALPRYRYDQLMYLGWKSFLPFALAYVFVFASIFFFFGYFPF